MCTALFADDVLIFTPDPASDMAIIKKYNYNRSKILTLGVSRVRSWYWVSSFPIAKSSITYLSINLYRIQKIGNELEIWMDLCISLVGRCHLFNMVSFTRLLYPLQAIPLLLKHKNVTLLNKVFTFYFVVEQETTNSFMYLPKSEGGVNLPNIRLYNLACLLHTGVNWISSTVQIGCLNRKLHPLIL